ncbi:MAG TPA: TFIIB-type zinc ribbon-containing protein [Clostridiaceae bacterium]|nr:TFIIB-type zinc ribbon-containing protein [Clostridiaceae bacterium]
MNEEENVEMQEDRATVIKTDSGAKDGQNKCPKCGATDISLNTKTGKLRCNFCRHEFEPEKLDAMEKDLSKLKGQIVGSGAMNIIADTNDMVTFKCSSCGAEVVVDTAQATQARCHWCRNTLSVNQQIPNGAVPDTVLPFSVPKKEAKDAIEKFVGKRKFYAHPQFRREFTTDNIMGVYLPYMIVDANTHAALRGQGEVETRRWTEKQGDSYKTYYDADLYNVEREFDLTIEGLTVESSKDKLDKSGKDKTNNIINSIMPFDTENCVKWDANYIKGYTSEKRDTNVEDLKELVEVQSKDIARYAANDTLTKYDRGVRWDSEDLEIKGQQWKSAYLPVWLYSYQQKKGEKSLLHYVAVNARTKETMGSVPIHKPKLFFISLLVELLGLVAMLFTKTDDNNWPWLFLLSGFVYFWIIYSKYRNTGARHNHETETKSNMSNLRKVDTFVRKRTRLDDSTMEGANNRRVKGSSMGINIEDVTKLIK